ncbi:hypothetical protein TL10_02810 [Mycolicibacterium llatzerense]|uniref:Uncharacterized protein n=1 Tax=Mycolicibacterium llatzerense TaxID=280871 RepID=A0A0D1LIS9_9MYCO|nr:hypothetical protein TL10_02810 [Mycolicibacterium llatzerense]
MSCGTCTSGPAGGGGGAGGGGALDTEVDDVADVVAGPPASSDWQPALVATMKTAALTAVMVRVRM